MTLDITVNGTQRSFNIGNSNIAKNVITLYGRYQSGRKYEDLQNCFANLNFLVQDKLGVDLEACQATHALALSVFDSETNVYKKYFIANSANSIIDRAKLCTHLNTFYNLWKMKEMECAKFVSSQGLNPQAAQEAGLLVYTKVSQT